jgi:hypothetical protein
MDFADAIAVAIERQSFGKICAGKKFPKKKGARFLSDAFAF